MWAPKITRQQKKTRIVDKKGQQQATIVVVCLVAECQNRKHCFFEQLPNSLK